MLSNVLWVLLRLCEPFLTMGDPKAEALANKTDLDYFHGSDRYAQLDGWMEIRRYYCRPADGVAKQRAKLERLERLVFGCPNRPSSGLMKGLLIGMYVVQAIPGGLLDIGRHFYVVVSCGSFQRVCTNRYRTLPAAGSFLVTPPSLTVMYDNGMANS